jgi:hypothetical protein
LLVAPRQRPVKSSPPASRPCLSGRPGKARDLLNAPKDGQIEKPTPIFKAARNTFLAALAARVRPNDRISTAVETERLLTRHLVALNAEPIRGLKTTVSPRSWTG